MKTVVLVAAVAMLAGCAAPVRVAHISEHYDATQAAAMVGPGANTITGSALVRQQGGGVVTCAGYPVHLIPATAYAEKRIFAIYGLSKYQRAQEVAGLRIEPDEPAYTQNRRASTCNAQGFFRFDNVADGDFFLQSTIMWTAGQYSTQGGGLIGRVKVSGGQTVEVTLAP